MADDFVTRPTIIFRTEPIVFKSPMRSRDNVNGSG